MQPFLHALGERTQSRLERLAGFAVTAWNISRDAPPEAWAAEIEREISRLRTLTDDPQALKLFRRLLHRMIPIAAATAPENTRRILDASVRPRLNGQWRLLVRSVDDP